MEDAPVLETGPFGGASSSLAPGTKIKQALIDFILRWRISSSLHMQDALDELEKMFDIGQSDWALHLSKDPGQWLPVSKDERCWCGGYRLVRMPKDKDSWMVGFCTKCHEEFIFGYAYAGLAEQEDAPDLSPGAERRGGSSPSTGTR